MGSFYLEKDRKIIEGVWEQDVRYWLAVEKDIDSPTPEQIAEYGNRLNSGSALDDDIRSFCTLTGWKWRQFQQGV
jgi:hypothetical protein